MSIIKSNRGGLLLLFLLELFGGRGRLEEGVLPLEQRLFVLFAQLESADLLAPRGGYSERVLFVTLAWLLAQFRAEHGLGRVVLHFRLDSVHDELSGEVVR